MESRVPVPTDNIFKFYALFGVLLFVFSCGALLYVSQSANDIVFSTIPELEGLKQVKQPSSTDAAKIALLQRKLEIAKANKDFFIKVLAGIDVVALFLIYHGFSRWHKEVQPILDRTARAQMEIAELQLEKLRRELKVQPPAKEEDTDADPA